MSHPLPFTTLSPARPSEDACGVIEALGPMPTEALVAMVDYGLNDAEIGRYFGISETAITNLRAYWQIRGNR